jgi:phosphopantothenoylcysteine decarboxylase / phosphopantothenate---cysteine ligase
MRLLITAGPTREPIDAVRFISNRSSGQLGLSLVTAALAQKHSVTAILGPVAFDLPAGALRIDVETTAQMHDAVLREFPGHDMLIMAAAPADFRPKQIIEGKMPRSGSLTLELEGTDDIVAAAAAARRPDQRTIAFSLEAEGNLDRARAKLLRKRVNMIVYNPIQTMNSADIQAALLYADGRSETLPRLPKADFAALLLDRAAALLANP